MAQNRADEVRRERRKKPGQVSQSGIKLAVNEEKLDRRRYHYRFVKAEPDRIRQLEALDYDRVPENAKEDGNSLGTTTTAFGGTTETGPYNMILMRKERDWFDTDQKEKMKPLDDMDDAIRRGQTNHAGNKDADSTFYTPGSDKDNPAGINRIESRSTR